MIGRLERLAIRAARASRWWPERLPDKRADRCRLGGRLTASVILFFPTGADTLYQLRPWLGVLGAVDRRFGLTIVFRDSRAAASVAEESGLDCLTLADYGQLDRLLQASEVRLCLYVNNHPINFECLRFASLTHVHLGHGDSDKRVTISNQMKAYDYCLLPGQAALERVRSGLLDYDADAHSILIGSPCLPVVGQRLRQAQSSAAGQAQPADEVAPAPRSPSLSKGRPRVLYAPTWESSQPSMSYGSVATMGRAIVDALADFDVVYRPHPLSGTIDPVYGRADLELRRLVAGADGGVWPRGSAGGRGTGRVDVGVPLASSFADADLLICDVSAVALAWLATRRPLVLVSSDAPAAPSRLALRVPVLRPSDDIRMIVDAALADPEPIPEELVTYYLGETDPELALERLLDVVADLIVRRDAGWARLVDGGLAGP